MGGDAQRFALCEDRVSEGWHRCDGGVEPVFDGILTLRFRHLLARAQSAGGISGTEIGGRKGSKCAGDDAAGTFEAAGDVTEAFFESFGVGGSE